MNVCVGHPNECGVGSEVLQMGICGVPWDLVFSLPPKSQAEGVPEVTLPSLSKEAWTGILLQGREGALRFSLFCKPLFNL